MSPIRRTILVAVALSMVGVACHSSSGPNPSEIVSPSVTPPKVVGAQLTTKGTKIYGPNGNPIRLIGVNLQGLQQSNDDGSQQPDECNHYWKKPPKEAAANIASWGFNTVRLNLGWANLEPTAPTKAPDGSLVHHWSDEYVKAVKDTVQSLADHKLTVILDPAQYQWSSAFKESDGQRVACEGYGMPSWLNPNASQETLQTAKCDFIANHPEPGVPAPPWTLFTEMWTFLAGQFKDNPAVVAADTANEPYFHPSPSPCSPGATPDFPGFFKTVGETIRAVSPHWLLIFEYFPLANDTFGLTSPPPFDNQLYSVHIYAPGWDAARQLMDPAWNQAQAWGMPLFLGEFDAFGEARNKPISGWQDQTKQMLDFMRENWISWTFFGYFGGLSMVDASGQPKTELISVLQQGF
jgi:aryl-phospho-beta-D-glucosidase BglC (GH1 family)